MDLGAGRTTQRSPRKTSARNSPGRTAPRSKRLRNVEIPREGDAQLEVEGKVVKLSNLAKPFWPDLGITKGDLLQFYADLAPVLLPHLENRAMVMKRYPNGAY